MITNKNDYKDNTEVYSLIELLEKHIENKDYLWASMVAKRLENHNIYLAKGE